MIAAADVVETGLAAAAAAPDHVSSSVIVSDASTVNLRWACNTLTTNGVGNSREVSVVVAVRTSSGVSVSGVSRSGTGQDVAGLVEQALRQARQAPAAEDSRDLPPGLVEDDFAAVAAQIGPEELSGTAEQLGTALEGFRSADAELFGFAEHHLTTTWLGTSAGTRRRHVQPSGTIELTGKSHQRSRSSYVNQPVDRLAEADVSALSAQLLQRLQWQGRRVEVAPGRYDTVLPASSLLDLLVYLYWSADARSAAEGKSVFSAAGGGTRIGERLSGAGFSLRSDPAAPGVGCAPFLAAAASEPTSSVFDNGLDLARTDWISDGVLRALPASRFTAEKAGVPAHPTIDNLVAEVSDPVGSLDDLIAGLDRGLLVTSLWYIREVDPITLLLTGLTRDGVYLVEGGEVTGATTNFRFNESPVALLGRLEAATGTAPALSREWADYFTRSAGPAVRVSGFNMSTLAQGT